MRLARLLLVAPMLLALAGCGRSSPEPCRAREGLSCADLASERDLERKDFDDAVKAGGAVGEQGTCVQAVVAEELERNCINDPCADLCDLHPCGLQDVDAGCVGGCQALVEAGRIDVASLQASLVRAAARPGLCTCAVCDEGSQPLCDELWVCAAAESP